jgi:hypothetical protein
MANISLNRCRPITLSEIITNGMRLGQFCPIMREKSIDASGDLHVDHHSNSVTASIAAATLSPTTTPSNQ